jgi:coatomer subunit beta
MQKKSKSKVGAHLKSQVDDLVKFRQLKPKRIVGGEDDDYETDLNRATGLDSDESSSSMRLDRIVPLTGYSDPVYVEALVINHQFDILLGKSPIYVHLDRNFDCEPNPEYASEFDY